MFEINKKIMFSDCDILGKISIHKAVQIVQDVVASSFEVENADNVTMKNKYNAMWVFTKNKIKLIKNILWNEDVRVRCYPVKTSFVKRIMLTEFINKNNEVCIYSVLECSLLDIATKSIKRLDEVGLTKSEEETSYNLKFSKFNDTSLALVLTKIVSLDMIDYSLHVNNSEYIRIIISSLDSKIYMNQNYNDFEVMYLHEAKEKDILKVFKGEQENECNYIIKNQKDEEILKAKFIFEK